MSLSSFSLANLALLVRLCPSPSWRAFSTAVPSRFTAQKVMGLPSTTSLTHEARTAAEPREHGMHKVILDRIEQANASVRLLRLRLPQGEQQLQFLPGQWLDVFVPGIPRAGGFTITSTPHELSKDNYVELAIQSSPKNPPAAWLWQQASQILQSELMVRVGGSFVWPPPRIDLATIERLVFIAGGVGINPLISIVSHLHQNQEECPSHLEFLYSARQGPSGNASSILFLDRLRSIFRPGFARSYNYKVFLTSSTSTTSPIGEKRSQTATSDNADTDYVREGIFEYRRFNEKDLTDALGPLEGRKSVAAYVCGPPPMTDWAVGVLRGAEGMKKERVLCEKWW